MPATAGTVRAIAVRTRKKGPMREVLSAEADVDRGIREDIEVTPERGITFISAEQWQQVMAELGTPLAWHTRRANVLVAGLALAPLIGKTVRLGDVEVRIAAETLPCGYMDELQPGLRQALKPDCRAGVYGRVVAGGRFRVGDAVAVVQG